MLQFTQVDVSIAENWDTMPVFTPSAICKHLRKVMVRDPDNHHLKYALGIQIFKVTEANGTTCMVG
jgi:hypothetical protein